MSTGWADCAPTFTWRPSQQRLLRAAEEAPPGTLHLVAPPGCGKTLLGLELARRVGRPALVLAPTVAVRDQWRRSVAMFGADPDTFTSDQPGVACPLTAVTYQLLGDPGDASAALTEAARRLAPEGAADVRRQVRALRRSLATGEDVGLPLRDLIGGRTADLVDLIAASGVRTVVLDECHHLLDWWALVIGALLERLREHGDVAVIGLTATPPDPSSALEERTYRGLLGDVDGEVHLPAVVAEGGICPWRDGVHLVGLTDDERTFLDGWAATFAAELDGWLVSEPFAEWAVARLVSPAVAAQDEVTTGWNRFWDADPLLAAALFRWWQARGMTVPAGFEPPPEAHAPLTLDDRIALLGGWLATAEVERSAELQKLMTTHGVAFGASGPRWGRSIGDLVCSRSAAKGRGAAAVLAAEHAVRGDDLRALVAVERDTAAAPPAAARRVLGDDPGTSAQVLAALCADPRTLSLGVIAVTSRGMWADAVHGELIAATLGAGTEGCDIPGAVRLVGGGGAARWLAGASAVLADGVAKVMVATRALVGEGWDLRPLNVVVDLAEDTSPAAATQLRGRALRIDPDHPDKVASLWDIAVVHPAAPGDYDRLRRRHQRWWGPDGEGAVVTGPAKVHARLAVAAPPDPDEVEQVNAASTSALADFDATRAAWRSVRAGGQGDPVLVVRRPRVRRQVRTRRATWEAHRRTGLVAVSASAALAAAVVALAVLLALPGLLAGCAVGVAGAAAGARSLAAARPRPADDGEVLLALGEALRDGLAAVGVAGLEQAAVTLRPDGAEVLAVAIGSAAERASTVWADGLAEMLGPLGSPRWMVAAGDAAWRVPAAVGATREAAERFTAALAGRLPDAVLVRAGTPEATQLVLGDAARRPPVAARSSTWR